MFDGKSELIINTDKGYLFFQTWLDTILSKSKSYNECQVWRLLAASPCTDKKFIQLTLSKGVLSLGKVSACKVLYLMIQCN